MMHSLRWLAVWAILGGCGEDEATKKPDPSQVEASDEEFGTAIQALSDLQPAEEVDIDKTVRVMHEIDAALTDNLSVSDYLDSLAKQDYRGVDPGVLAARKRILELQFAIYAKQTELDDRQASWDLTRALLTTASVVEAKGEVSQMGVPTGGVSLDRDQATKLLTDLQQEAKEQRKLKADVQSLEMQLFDAVSGYSTLYWDRFEEWDRLCGHRDRAYLAVRQGDWDTVLEASDAAIALAPHEREAHLLKAMALIERGNPEDLGIASSLVDGYIAEHPSQDAPALLLRGIIQTRRGNKNAATLSFQEAAAHYPKQSEALTDMLDPYEMRSWLRKSREGGTIVEQYQAMMLGAGYFSPDLQMAKAAFEKGDVRDGRTKVMDHFARRRSAATAADPNDRRKLWGFILQDVEQAEQVLGSNFQEMFPEDSFLDLEVAPTTLYPNRQVSVQVKNRSDETLHNATLILAVHFTDMHPADYEPFAAERTIPAVDPHGTTDFGTVQVSTTLWGQEKGVSDIVQHRALLLTDEAVLWVDSDAYKIAEAKEFREARRSEIPLPEQKSPWHEQMRSELTKTAGGLSKGAEVEVDAKYGFNDDIKITLPSQVTLFRPVFTLKYAGHEFKAKTNQINADHVELVFPKVGNFDGKELAKSDLELVMNSVYGDVSVVWKPDGPMEWKFEGSKTE